VTVIATALLGSAARAQVSPGPLAAAHRPLDKLTQCFQCHTTGGAMTEKCLACHTEIGWLAERNRGFHAHVRATECAKCHPDHAGVEFRMISWEGGSPDRFDHRRAGYALAGKHATVPCRDCHQPKNQRSAVAGRIRKTDRSASWLGLDTACGSCHGDPHAGRFGAGCESCHAPSGWKEIREAGFDHDKTRYPLQGKHASVACARCHDPVRAFGKTPAFATCGDCHRDAHAGRATLAGRPADCATCHTVEGFERSTFTVARHRKSGYPLEGRHAAVACSACHIRLGRGERAELVGTSGVLLRPLHDACARCHVDAHGGQLASAKRPDRGACEGCHTVQGFAPSTITAASHARLKLPLEGRHAAIACAACHGATRAGLPAPHGAPKAGPARFVFAVDETRCADCHFDPHRGRFAAGGARPSAGGCEACHGVTAWSPSRVDVAAHRRTRFPLDGAHGAVPCAGCHREMTRRADRSTLIAAAAHPAPLPFTVERRDCAGCHESPHGTQFAKRSDRGACGACHDTERFRPAGRFNHDRDVSFRLEGAHARVACARCHPSERGAKGTVRVVYRGVPGRCEACHAQEDRHAKIGS
jgi:hypothetical protein